MSKKILASLLAAASILSMSAVAFAADAKTTTYDENSQPDATGLSYDVGVGITYGKVNCIVPSASSMKTGSVFVNPYGAAITTSFKTVKVKNTNFIASDVYEVTNNDTDNELKVLATVSVKKATGLVIVDGSAEAPDGWSVAEDKSGKKIVRDDEEVNGYKPGENYDPLVSYDKITLTYKSKDDKSAANIDKAVGGAVSAKQAMNTAVYLAGNTDAEKVVDGRKEDAANNIVDFYAKGTNGGTLVKVPAKGTDPGLGYFTVCGDLNPAIDKEKYSWNKEALDLVIVLKLVPVPTDATP